MKAATDSLVELFAAPLRTRLRQLTDRADLVDHTRTELRGAATSVAEQRDQLRTRSTDVTEHWTGSAAGKFGGKAAAATGTLTTTAELLAAGDVLVDNAIAGLRTGHATVARLLDEYTSQGTKVLAAATRLLNAGQSGALINAAGYLSQLAGRYSAEADTAYHTAREALVTATAEFTALERQLPAGPPPQHRKPTPDPHHKPTGTSVNIGHGLGTVTAPNAAAATAVRTALSQLGVPYVWGGESPGHAFDCSGLTAYAYGRAGISLPHFASSQRIGKQVPVSQLQPGDLVIFSGHVTMYIGKGHVVAAPHTGTDVQIEPLFTSIPGDPFLGCYRPSVRA